MVVVFPAPFGPKKPKHSPPETLKSTPQTGLSWFSPSPCSTANLSIFLETFTSLDPGNRRHSPEAAGVWDHARVGEDLGNGTYTTVSRLSDQGQASASHGVYGPPGSLPSAEKLCQSLRNVH